MMLFSEVCLVGEVSCLSFAGLVLESPEIKKSQYLSTQESDDKSKNFEI